MTEDELIDAMSPFMETFGATLSATQWKQYWEALQDVNPGDLDDAMRELRRTHKFHNAPLPYEILAAAQVARRRRVVSQPEPEVIAVNPNEAVREPVYYKGELVMHIPVLPDGHRALKQYHCIRCNDSGWHQFQRQGSVWMYGANAPMLEYAERCHCTPTNPVLQRQRTQNAAHATAVANKRRSSDE